MEKQKALVQIVWGGLLTSMGLSVFFIIIPDIMDGVKRIGNFSPGFTRFCFFLIGAMLVGGGIRKIIQNYRLLQK
jgi:hypothetical protein